MQSGKQTWKHQVKTSTEAEHSTRSFSTVFCLLHPVHPADIHLPGVTFTSTASRALTSSPVCVAANNHPN
ncbi:uncharacterized [Lates japonicus]